MYEIDKKIFAAFLTQLRKAQGMTQKDLAEKLFVSDKAVSKWERGLSMPDISLLIPLSETLGVTVTELLEGRRLETQDLPAGEVEEIVKKALHISEGTAKPNPKKAWPMLLAIVAAALELFAVWRVIGFDGIGSSFFVFFGLSFFFGIYFWFFLAQRLPSYYDEHEISYYSDGFLRMNFVGVALNNANWPRIVKALRLWSVISLAAILPLGVLVGWTAATGMSSLMLQMVCLELYLASLFVPVYLCAHKPGKGMGKEKKQFWTTMVVLLCLLPFLFQGSFRNGTRIGYFEDSNREAWSGSYVRLDGWMQRSLYPKKSSYLIQVTSRDGSLSIDISDEAGLVFSETDIPTGAYPVTLNGKVTVKVTAENHRGSFSIEPK